METENNFLPTLVQFSFISIVIRQFLENPIVICKQIPDVFILRNDFERLVSTMRILKMLFKILYK